MSDILNFWDNTHPLAAKSEELYHQLVPFDGNCSTIQGLSLIHI